MALIEALKDRDLEVRDLVLDHLSQLSDMGIDMSPKAPEILSALIGALKDEDLKARSEGRDRGKRSAKPGGVGEGDFDNRLDDQRRALEFRIKVVLYIGRLGAEAASARPALEEALKSSKVDEFSTVVSETLEVIRLEVIRRDKSATRRTDLQPHE